MRRGGTVWTDPSSAVGRGGGLGRGGVRAPAEHAGDTAPGELGEDSGTGGAAGDGGDDEAAGTGVQIGEVQPGPFPALCPTPRRAMPHGRIVCTSWYCHVCTTTATQ